ncbi:MAG: serine hydrolase [Eubacteriales bacterium]|nr:serine hydrolase [Eubacteriales bacterium]
MKYNNKKIYTIMLTILTIICISAPIYASNNTSYIAINLKTKKVLEANNEDKKIYPASLTKILSSIIVLENCNLNDEIIIDERMISNFSDDSSQIHLQIGDKYTIKDLLYALLFKSANDATYALSIYTTGSIDSFVKLMNNKVKMLNLYNTHFTNPTGIFDNNHYTTAYDFSIICKYAYENEDFLKIFENTNYFLPYSSFYPNGVTISVGNKMMKHGASEYDEKVIAGKNGHTTLSKYTLASFLRERDKDSLVLAFGYDTEEKIYNISKEIISKIYNDNNDYLLQSEVLLNNDTLKTNHTNSILQNIMIFVIFFISIVIFAYYLYYLFDVKKLIKKM